MVAGETKATAARTTLTLAGDLLITEHLTAPSTPSPWANSPPRPTRTGRRSPGREHLHRQLQRVLTAAGTDETLPP
ncbi:hypothetical protein ACN24M_03115 [Streptomyces microflavus]